MVFWKIHGSKCWEMLFYKPWQKKKKKMKFSLLKILSRITVKKKKYNLSDFKSLLQIKDICSHHKNILNLMIEMFKIKNQTAPPIMDSMFERRIFNNFWQKEKELCIMVLIHLVIGLRNYGLYYQKTLWKFHHSKKL